LGEEVVERLEDRRLDIGAGALVLVVIRRVVMLATRLDVLLKIAIN
jgi:hypothetical protein